MGRPGLPFLRAWREVGCRPFPRWHWLHFSCDAGSCKKTLFRGCEASPGCGQRGTSSCCKTDQPQDTWLCPDKGKPFGAGRGHHSLRPSPVLQAFSTEGSQMSKSGLRWVPDAEESLSKTGRPQQGRATLASWS